MMTGVSAQSTVEDVVERMRGIAAELPPDDGAAIFNGVYLRVTEMVRDRLADGGVFHDEAFMAGLDVRFAELWFEAYDARPGAVPHAWAPLFEARNRAGLWPIQHALAGMNAHIEHDLPLAVVRSCVADDRSPLNRDVHDDYERVNDLLADVEAEIRRSFLTDVERAADDRLGPLVHLVSSWDIEKARDVAWTNVLTLWELRRIRVLFDDYLAGLSRTVGMGSRLLLTPVAP